MDDARRKRQLTAGAIALVALGACGLGYWSWASRDTGATCRTDDDCTSRACLIVTPGFGGRAAGVCTEICATDDDCPGDMTCEVAARTRAATPLGSRERRVCHPSTERIRELIRDR